jgi:Ig-like domain from next to BRCA1 gene
MGWIILCFRLPGGFAVKRNLLISFILAALVLALGGCGSSKNNSATETPVSPEAIYTSAAQTADARLQERFTQATTPAPAMSPTAAVTNTPTITATPSQPTPAGTASAPPSTGDRAEFVADVTIPDGTNMAPNQSFAKTWRLVNNGTTTWNSSYALVFSSGTSMSAPAVVNLPASVPPGQNADITVNLVAPATPGEYIGYFILKNPSGQIFGVGPNAVDAIWVQIVVGSATPVSTLPAGTVTPGATQQSASVSGVALSVDSASASTCPHTFTYTAQFSLSQPANVTYQLEASVSDPNITLSLPAPSTVALPAGSQSVVYTLIFNANLNGTAVFHITLPSDIKSNTVNFTLNCP